jgi:LytR cell envelope-related transcriptional attenuator
VILAAVGVIAVLVVLLVVTGLGSSAKKPSQSTVTTNTPTGHRSLSAAVSPASVTVAVLNGTSVNGLASRIGQNLAGLGYKKGVVANASDQTHTTTIVAYLPGFRRDALAVAASLKLTGSSVQPIDQPTRQVACPSSGTCNANVVVTLGQDLANAP